MSYLATLASLEQDFQRNKGASAKKQPVPQYESSDEEDMNVDEKYLASYAEKYKNDELLVDDVELEEAEMEAYKNLMKAKRLIEQREAAESSEVGTVSDLFLRDTEDVYEADAIKACLNKLPILSKNLDWIHTLQIKSPVTLQVDNPEDDIDREIQFYNQAILTAKEGFKNLFELDIPIHRPDDYFAEMVKSDEHMARIRNKLVQSRKVIEDREKRRQRKEQQKIGKQLKAERLKEKISKKKTDIQAVEHWKKVHGGTGKEFDVDSATREYSDMVSEQKKDKKQQFATKRKDASIKKRPGKRKRQKQQH